MSNQFTFKVTVFLLIMSATLCISFAVNADSSCVTAATDDKKINKFFKQKIKKDKSTSINFESLSEGGETKLKVLKGEVLKSFAGELNSLVVDDGGLIILKNDKKNILIYEPDLMAPKTSIVESILKSGNSRVAIDFKCLKRVSSKDEKEVLAILAEDIFGKQLDLTIYQFN